RFGPPGRATARPTAARSPAAPPRPTQAKPRTSSSPSWPVANRVPSRSASRTSPSTNRSPTAVPASPEMSAASPTTRPRAKLPSVRAAAAMPAFARSTFSASAGSIGRFRSRARSRKLMARQASAAASGGDLARRSVGVEGARDRVIGERRRIVLGGEQELRLEGAWRGGQRGEREGDGKRERHCDARCGHGIVLLLLLLIILRFLSPTTFCLQMTPHSLPPEILAAASIIPIFSTAVSGAMRPATRYGD